MFFYVEITDGKITSWGNATSMDAALLATEKSAGMVREVSEKMYNLVSACKGYLATGISMLQSLERYVKESGED
jgi:hypothetical protein